ncbi:MAG TPA: AI-2E family transporter [Thermomicrobiales bacterium]|nr:AI-2E family transporter [Thermomicrobiales bacterium]
MDATVDGSESQKAGDDHLANVAMPRDHVLTHIPITPRTRNVLIGIAVAAVLLLMWRAPGVVQLVIVGAAVAVVLSFPVRALSRVLPRGIAMLVVILAALLAFAVALVVLIPIAAAQLGSLLNNLPAIGDELDRRLRWVLDSLASHGMLRTSPAQAMSELETTFINRANGLAEGVLTNAFNSLSGALGWIFQAFSIILVAVYLLADSGRIKSLFIRSFPFVYRDDAAELWDDVGHNLSRYLGGLLISLAFQGVAATTMLLLLHVPYALLLGLWTTVAAIIPVIGSYFAAFPAILVALFISPMTAVFVAVTYFAINMIDGNLIAPRVQGKALDVPPLLVFLAVIAGGQIAGFWGILLAVPTLAVLRAVWVFFDQRLVVRPDAHQAYALARAAVHVSEGPAAETAAAAGGTTVTVQVVAGANGEETSKTIEVTPEGEFA